MAIWKVLTDFPSYEVSSLGDMRRIGKEACLKGLLDQDGYYHVRPYEDGVGSTKTLHRLIALTFIPPVPGKPEVNHKNGIKTDNRVENLEWVSRTENNTHTRRVLKKMIGALIPTAKLTDAAVRDIRSSPLSNVALSKIYEVDKSIISRVRSRKTWSHVA